jgi:hypothetical protein
MTTWSDLKVQILERIATKLSVLTDSIGFGAGTLLTKRIAI